MTDKSEIVHRLDHVQQELNQLFKPLGFRRKGRTFFRISDVDIVQVIALQAGSFEIGLPPPPEAAHLRPNLYGKFTVNLGVFVPEIYERDHFGFAPKGVINDTYCSIRTRLSHVASHQDIWWSLAEELDVLVEDVGSLLLDVGIPFLERFGSRDSILRDWVLFNDHELRLTLVARLDTAMVLLKRGEVGAAKALLEDHMAEYRKDPRSPGHEQYVRELALELGLGDLK